VLLADALVERGLSRREVHARVDAHSLARIRQAVRGHGAALARRERGKIGQVDLAGGIRGEARGRRAQPGQVHDVRPEVAFGIAILQRAVVLRLHDAGDSAVRTSFDDAVGARTGHTRGEQREHGAARAMRLLHRAKRLRAHQR
jgi:hypothetical protein